MKKALFGLGLVALAFQVHAQSVGSLAIIAANTDGDDNFAWLALSDFAPGTTINFTDSSWQGSAFRGTEHLDAGGPLTWTATGSISAGTVVRYSGLGANSWSTGTVGGVGLNLAASGDQIFAYQGSNSSPSFIYGLQLAVANGIVKAPTVSNSTNTTNVPTTLALGASMLDLGNFDNGYYSGTTTGSAEELLSAIGNTSNWTLSNTELSPSNWATGFSVTAVPEPETYAMLLAGLGLIGSMVRCRKV